MLATLDHGTDRSAFTPANLDNAPDPEPTVTMPVGLFVAWLTRPAPRPKRKQPPSKYRLLRWQKILSAVNEREPRTGKEIARDSRLRDDSALRQDLSELCRQGKIMRATGEWGYKLVTTTEGA
jgi:hypothetical protein